MRLFEFDNNSVTSAKIVALTNQLKQDLDSGEIDLNFSTDDLLDYFRQYDVILDRDDLYNMVKVPPLKDVVTNIQGDKVVFKGQNAPGEAPKDENQKVVSQMAKHALKK